MKKPMPKPRITAAISRECEKEMRKRLTPDVVQRLRKLLGSNPRAHENERHKMVEEATKTVLDKWHRGGHKWPHPLLAVVRNREKSNRRHDPRAVDAACPEAEHD